MADSLKSFATLFSAVLLLHGEQPPVTKLERVRAAVRLLGLDGETFERVAALRAGADGVELDEDEANELFASYMHQVERVIEAVDRVEVSAGS